MQLSTSTQLQGLFERFRAWLLKIYGSLRALKANFHQEVRAVFDRMLASQDEIQQAEQIRSMRPLFHTAAAAGMSETEFAEYLSLRQAASALAKRRLQRKALGDMQWLHESRNKNLKQLQQQHSQVRRQVRKQISAQVLDQPVYQAWDILTAKKSDVKLDIAELLSMGVSPEQIAKFSHYGMLGSQGEWPVAAIAEWYDFNSGPELLHHLAQAEPPNKIIRRLTDQYMLENYAELGSRPAMKAAVQSALHNETRGKFLAMEAQSLAIRSGHMQFSAQTLEDYAQQMLHDLKLKAIHSSQYIRAEARCAAACSVALEQGHSQQAAQAKRAQLINFYAAKYALQLEQEVAQSLEYCLKFSQGNHQLPFAEVMLIQGLLDKFYIAAAPTAAASFERNLQQWLLDMSTLGIQVVFPHVIVYAKAQAYQELRPEQFKQLLETINMLAYQGGREKRIYSIKAPHNYLAARRHMLASLKKNAEHIADYRMKHLQFNNSFNAYAARAAMWVALLDGGEGHGPVWDYLMRPALISASFESVFRAQIFLRLGSLLETLAKYAPFAAHAVYFPHLQRTFSRENCLVIALYTANHGSLHYLLSAEKWTPDDIQPVLDTLTAEDWRVVQQIWDLFSRMRKQVRTQFVKIYGVEPHWQAPLPRLIHTKNQHGAAVAMQLKGGYYPLRFDPAGLGQRAPEHISNTTRISFIKPYDLGEAQGRLLYSLSALFSATQSIIHDLAWQDNIVDIHKFGYDEKLMKVIFAEYGPQPVQAISSWVKDLSHVSHADFSTETALEKFKDSPLMAGLGYELMNHALQALDFYKVPSALSHRALATGISRYLDSRHNSLEFALDLSKFMRHRNRCLDRKLSDSECRPNSPWKRTGAGRVFMENLQGLPIARRVIREQEVPPSSDVDGQGAAGIKPCRCRPILGQGRTKIFTVGIRHSLH
jgi:hypothetical protein